MDFHREIKSKEDALISINEMVDDYKSAEGSLTDFEKSEIYNSAIWTLQELAENKKIEYKGYFRTKYEKHSEFETILGAGGHEEHESKRELYVFMAAIDHLEIYDILKYVFYKTKNIALGKAELLNLIDAINSRGYSFERN